MTDPIPSRAGGYADRGFRILAQILDEAARAEAEGLLFDPVTQLPTLQLLLAQIRSTLAGRSQVGLITVIVNPFVRFEELFGWDTYDQVVRTVAAALDDLKVTSLREGDTVAELSMSGNSFVLVLSPPRQKRFVVYDDLDRLRARISEGLTTRLASAFAPEIASKFSCSIGCSVIQQEPGVPVERLVLRGVDQAYGDAFRERDRKLAARVTKLTGIIEQRELLTLYQPVVDLQQATVLGYEAFTRGPAGEFKDPSYLFKVAYEAELLWKLERACREQALARAAELPEGSLLFLNIDPDSIFDPELRGSAPLRELAGRVVLEITERAAISDYALLRHALDVIRDLGLRFAIDDVGSAYSGLRLIAEIQPNFVKLDMALTGGVRENVVRNELVRTVARVAEKLNAPLIVEGVQSPEQLDALVELGIRYAQGFLFGLPEPRFAAVPFGSLAIQRRP